MSEAGSASQEESVGDASEAPEEEAAPPRLGLAFTDLTIESMEALNDANTVKAKLQILCELTEVNHYQDNTWSGVFVDYLYYGLAFAAEQSFSDEQTSALFSILKNVFEHAFPVEPDADSNPLEENHAFFKDQMLTHSVDDAEAGCIQLFSVEDVTQISNFLSTTFYRHYNSYKYAYTTTQPEETVHHDLIVETPLPPPPLCEGQLFGEAVPEPCVEAPAPAPAPYYEEDHVEYYGEDPEYLESYKAYVRGRRLDAERQEDPSLTKAREDAMAMLAQLKADEEAGLVEPTEWTVVEPDEPRPDWVPPATPPDVREKLAAREAGPGWVPPSTPPEAATAAAE